jgi:hypothetical protein
VSVVATMANVALDLDVEDYGLATYKLSDGSIMSVESTWHAPHGAGDIADRPQCTITGTTR